jgi:hypothetical protein
MNRCAGNRCRQTRLKAGEAYFEIFSLQRDNFDFDKPKIQYWAIVVKPGESKPTLFQISEGEAFEIRSLRNYQNRVRTQLEDSDSYNTVLEKNQRTTSRSQHGYCKCRWCVPHC